MKDFLLALLFVFILISFFGGGCIYWLVFCLIFKIEGIAIPIGCGISLFVFHALGGYLKNKFEKYS